jgi:hypothetical protein
VRARGYTLGLFIVTIGYFAAICSLWMSGAHAGYFAWMHFFGVDAWDRPFLDLIGVLSWGECHRHGVDVLHSNPCDPLGRLMSYSPLLLHLPFRVRDAAALGLLQGFGFLIALQLVLRPRTFGEFGFAVVAATSPAVLFALERSNLDLGEFVLLALTGPLVASGGIGRLCSYVLYFAGGALKFYPFALLGMLVREKMRVVLALGLIAALLLAAFATHYWVQLTAIRSLLPQFDYDAEVFSAFALPFGAARILDLPDIYGSWALTILIVVFGGLAIRRASRVRPLLADADWNGMDLHYFLIGSIVTTGCFFTQTNIVYRAIFLIFLLPALPGLHRTTGARTFAVAPWAISFCLWSAFFRQWIGRFIDAVLDAINPHRSDDFWWNLPSNLFFVGRELIWWWLVSAMLSAILVFLLASPLGSAVTTKLFRRQRGPEMAA